MCSSIPPDTATATATQSKPPLLIQYVSKASSTLRAALREPARSKAAAQETFGYNRSQWADGKQGAKTLVDSLGSVGK